MKKILLPALALSLFSMACTLPALAADRGSKDEAVAMVKKAVALIKADGKDKAFAAIGDPANASFHDRDLYIYVYDMNGVTLAHGNNPKMVGKNLIELKDIDGKAFVKERVEMGKAKPHFWQDYKFTNPETKKIEPKQMYCERLNETVVCGGIYL